MAAAKGKVTLVLADYQRRGLSQEARRFGVGISEFLRRAFDDPAVMSAIRALPMYQPPEPPRMAGAVEFHSSESISATGPIRRVSRA